MSDYVYGGQDNRQFYVDPGDYKFEVVGFETKISAGDKTRGSRITELKLKLEPSGSTCFAGLLFHPSCDWRLDTFCRCTGLECKIGETPAELKSGDERLLVGLRGWGTFGVKEVKGGKKYNELLTWITNKEKLIRKPPPTAEEVAKAAASKPSRSAAGAAHAASAAPAPVEDDVPF